MNKAETDLESIEHRGYVDFYRAAPESLASRHGIAVVELGGDIYCAAVRDRANPILWNHCGGLTSAVDEATIDRIVDVFDRCQVRGAVQVPPSVASPPLTAWLRDRGFAPGYAWAKFRRAIDAPIPAAPVHDISECGSADAETFARIVVAAFGAADWFVSWLAALVGRPGWSCYLARVDGAPAATGAIFRSGTKGWVTWGATSERFRRRGLQRAMLVHRIAAARAMGIDELVTETGERDDGVTEPSYRNILWSGFERVYRRENYVREER